MSTGRFKERQQVQGGWLWQELTHGLLYPAYIGAYLITLVSQVASGRFNPFAWLMFVYFLTIFLDERATRPPISRTRPSATAVPPPSTRSAPCDGLKDLMELIGLVLILWYLAGSPDGGAAPTESGSVMPWLFIGSLVLVMALAALERWDDEPALAALSATAAAHFAATGWVWIFDERQALWTWSSYTIMVVTYIAYIVYWWWVSVRGQLRPWLLSPLLPAILVLLYSLIAGWRFGFKPMIVAGILALLAFVNGCRLHRPPCATRVVRCMGLWAVKQTQ
ncbi:MAG: hypothetical protein D6701_07010 [Gemmatimonadetes bacterium]|nr:MAG: hypothetical protein D6701_07010 [Gemmatimonadota bacterium]